jgi:hypothetical protein
VAHIRPAFGRMWGRQYPFTSGALVASPGTHLIIAKWRAISCGKAAMWKSPTTDFPTLLGGCFAFTTFPQLRRLLYLFNNLTEDLVYIITLGDS